MLIATAGESPVKTGERGSDPGLSFLLGVLERMEGAVGSFMGDAEEGKRANTGPRRALRLGNGLRESLGTDFMETKNPRSPT